MTSHEGADVSQYGGRVDCADSDGSASGRGVVTAGGCTGDGSAVAVNEALADTTHCSQRAAIAHVCLESCYMHVQPNLPERFPSSGPQLL